MSRFADYLTLISQTNTLSGPGDNPPIQWLFHCGMLFSSLDKWWGDFKYRKTPHEGIDITYYRTHTGKIQCFDDSIKVPALDDGIILNICDDFLGQTLVVEHERLSCGNGRTLFIYSHIIPDKTLEISHSIAKGQLIARVCDTCKNPQLPPHLHFSCFEIPKKILPSQLDWTFFSTHNDISMVHPVFL